MVGIVYPLGGLTSISNVGRNNLKASITFLHLVGECFFSVFYGKSNDLKI